MLRQEEALTTRPKARRLEHPAVLTATSVASPASGQDYVKLPFADAASFLVEGKPRLQRSVTGECGAFFEHWLASHYRRSSEDLAMDHLVFFPALLTPRQELAGIVRFPVHVEWSTANGSAFQPPSAGERAKKHYPEPPQTLTVIPAADADGASLFVDTRALHELLRIDQDRLERWLTEHQKQPRTPRETLTSLCQLVTEQLPDDTTPSAIGPKVEASLLLEHFSRLIRQRLTRLGSSCKAYDVGVLLDASRNRATFHVQRDLQQALDLLDPELADQPLPASSPLSTYLGSERKPGKRAPFFGRFNGHTLTESQRAAGELFLGSKVCAVQGPPGTGKTHLILSLAAQQLVDNTLALCEAKQPRDELLVVTSTNNRAVDNVIDALCRDAPGLPLALRVGSRDVMDRLTATELERTARWLERHPEPSDAQWDVAIKAFKQLHETVLAVTKPETEQRDVLDKGEALRQELATLQRALAQTAETPLLPRGLGIAKDASVDLADLSERATGSVQQIKAHTTNLLLRLKALSALAEAETKTALTALSQHFKLTTTRHLGPLSELLGTSLSLGLPPKVNADEPIAERLTRWEEATEAAIGLVTELDEWASRVYARQTSQLRSVELAQQLEHLPSSDVRDAPVAADWTGLEPTLHELFRAAGQVRELWALRNKKPILESLTRAIGACKSLKSLRSLTSASKGPGQWLARLYPVWGCTLLSLGNNFSPEPDSLAKVVIDEAGQCHPAYAVSALLRAKSILVIGDTNQLEPVIELSAADEGRLLKQVKEKYHPGLAPYRAFENSSTSAQSVADRVVATRPVLVDHFRCQPEIAAICEQLCHYGLVARTPPRSCADRVPELSHPVLLSTAQGEQQRWLGSWGNEVEVAQVSAWVTYLLRNGLVPADIGIITPFRGQLDLLWRELRTARIPLEKPLVGDDDDQLSLLGHASSGVALGTVHRFQGGERRVIVFSTTVTDVSSLRFLNERVNLVNVAASRAKEHLLTVGHAPTLLQGANSRLLVRGARATSLSLTAQ